MKTENRNLKEASKAFENAAKSASLALNEWCEVLESFSKKQTPKKNNNMPDKKQIRKDIIEGLEEYILSARRPSQKSIGLFRQPEFKNAGIISKAKEEKIVPTPSQINKNFAIIKGFRGNNNKPIRLEFKGFELLCARHALRNKQYIKEFIQQISSKYIEPYTEEELNDFIKKLDDYEK